MPSRDVKLAAQHTPHTPPPHHHSAAACYCCCCCIISHSPHITAYTAQNITTQHSITQPTQHIKHITVHTSHHTHHSTHITVHTAQLAQHPPTFTQGHVTLPCYLLSGCDSEVQQRMHTHTALTYTAHTHVGAAAAGSMAGGCIHTLDLETLSM